MEKMDAHHHVCPKKSTQNHGHLRIWPPVISSNWSWRVKDPGKKQKMMLSNKSSNLQQLSFFRMQKKVCVCVLLLFSPQKNPMNVMKIFFRGVLWSSIVSLFICCMVLCFHRKGCHEYTILQPQIWSHVRCLQRRGTIRSAITENEIAILSIW